jgi:hypothetical protein
MRVTSTAPLGAGDRREGRGRQGRQPVAGAADGDLVPGELEAGGRPLGDLQEAPQGHEQGRPGRSHGRGHGDPDEDAGVGGGEVEGVVAAREEHRLQAGSADRDATTDLSRARAAAKARRSRVAQRAVVMVVAMAMAGAFMDSS